MDIFYEEAYVTENYERFFHLLEFDIDIRRIYHQIKDVLSNGQLSFNFNKHSALLKFYVNYVTDSEITKKAIDY